MKLPLAFLTALLFATPLRAAEQQIICELQLIAIPSPLSESSAEMPSAGQTFPGALLGVKTPKQCADLSLRLQAIKADLRTCSPLTIGSGKKGVFTISSDLPLPEPPHVADNASPRTPKQDQTLIESSITGFAYRLAFQPTLNSQGLLELYLDSTFIHLNSPSNPFGKENKISELIKHPQELTPSTDPDARITIQKITNQASLRDGQSILLDLGPSRHTGATLYYYALFTTCLVP